MLSALLLGLSGDALDLDEVRTPAFRLVVTRLIFALGGKGTANGDGTRNGVVTKAAAAEDGRGGGESDDGDGDLAATKWKGCDREGDLERERRNDRMALVASGWCICV